MHNEDTFPTIRKTVLIFLVILALSIGCYLFYLVRGVLLEMVVGLLFALALEPVVAFLIRKGFKRSVAAITSVLVTLIVVVGFAMAVATPLISQGSDLIINAPQIFQQVTSNATFISIDTKYQIIDKLRTASYGLLASATGGNGSVFGFLGSILGGVSSFAVVMVLALFLLIEGPSMWKKFLSFLSPVHEARIIGASKKMSRAVSGFVLGNLLTSFIAGTVALATLLILHVPYAFALAGVVAFLDLIPLIGTILATVIVGLVALTQGIVVTGIVVAVLLVYQFIEGNILQPLIYSRTISLSPLMIILATIMGAELGGVLGVLLATPVAAVLQIAILELFQRKKS